MPSLRTTYLVTYNVVQAIGWAIALYKIDIALWETRSLSEIYKNAGEAVGV